MGHRGKPHQLRLCSDDPLGHEPRTELQTTRTKTRRRMLRTYRRFARQEHFCDQCCTSIQPGECYEGRVELTARGEIIVWKQHVDPRCEWPEPPDDEDEDSQQGTTVIAKAA